MKTRIIIVALLVIVATVLGIDTADLLEEEPYSLVEELSDSSEVLNLQSEETTVTRVIDGDTIEIETGERVRYIGIDTPEVNNSQDNFECFAVDAKDFNTQLVEGKKVRLEKDVSETDRYGRLLRYVWVSTPDLPEDEIFVNDELIRNGYAKVSTYPPDVKYQDKFLVGERDAMENGVGLWSSCD